MEPDNCPRDCKARGVRCYCFNYDKAAGIWLEEQVIKGNVGNWKSKMMNHLATRLGKGGSSKTNLRGKKLKQVPVLKLRGVRLSNTTYDRIRYNEICGKHLETLPWVCTRYSLRKKKVSGFDEAWVPISTWRVKSPHSCSKLKSVGENNFLKITLMPTDQVSIARDGLVNRFVNSGIAQVDVIQNYIAGYNNRSLGSLIWVGARLVSTWTPRIIVTLSERTLAGVCLFCGEHVEGNCLEYHRMAALNARNNLAVQWYLDNTTELTAMLFWINKVKYHEDFLYRVSGGVMKWTFMRLLKLVAPLPLGVFYTYKLLKKIYNSVTSVISEVSWGNIQLLDFNRLTKRMIDVDLALENTVQPIPSEQIRDEAMAMVSHLIA